MGSIIRPARKPGKNGATETRKRRPIEHDLRASRLVLASFLAKYGYDDIRSVTKDCLINRWGTVTPGTMAKVEDAVRFLLGL